MEVDISEVIQRPPSDPIIAANLEYPRTGLADGGAFQVFGWVVSKAPIAGLEFVHEGSVVARCELTLPRPDVDSVHGSSSPVGFWKAIGTAGLAPAFTVEVWAVLEDGRRNAIAEIRGTQPLALSLSRSVPIRDEAEANRPAEAVSLAERDLDDPLEPFDDESLSDDAAPPPDDYQGNLDLCTSTRLEGWAVKDGVPAELDVAVNDRTVARIRCSLHRPDLVPHGLPIDAGFEFVFDAPIAPCDEVSVRFAGGPELTNSPNRPLPIETSGTKRTDGGSTKGNEFLGYLVDLCELQPGDAVLQVGCGSGRTALPLTGYLNREGRYAGFDIARKAIAWCRENISGSHPNFDFTVADVQKKWYNPKGKHKPSDFRFPYADESFDVVLVTSEFTRMLPADLKHYMDEIVRVLKPGGRSLMTFFLLNELSSTLSKKGMGSITFQHEMQGARTAEVNDPEAAIAYPEAFVRDLYKECGLELRQPLRYGTWCGRRNGMSGQDVVIADKPARQESPSPRSASR